MTGTRQTETRGSSERDTSSGRQTTAQQTVVVEDSVVPAASQMARSQFITTATDAIRRAVEQELQRYGRTTEDCPYLDLVLRYYSSQSAAEIDAVVRSWARPVDSTPDAYVQALVAQSRDAAVRFQEQPGSGIRSLISGLDLPFGLLRAVALAKPEGGGSAARSVDVAEASAGLGSGRPLESTARSDLERSFGARLAHVRVHEGGAAGSMARGAGAHAMTLGNDIVFAPGRYQPAAPWGRALLAHEVAHTVQQQRSGPASEAALETEADQAATAAMLGQHRRPSLSGGLRFSRCDPVPTQRLERPPTEAATQLATRYRGASNPLGDRRFFDTWPPWRTYPGGYHLLIDADGDQSAELWVSLRPTDGQDRRLSSIGVELRYKDTDTTASHTFTTGEDWFPNGFFPTMQTVSDGHEPTRISLGSAGAPTLEIGVPMRGEASMTVPLAYIGRGYSMRPQNQQHASLVLVMSPPRQYQVFRMGPVQHHGPIWSLDGDVGAYGDRIRLTVVRDRPLDPNRSETHAVRIGWVPLSRDGRPLGGGGETSMSVSSALNVRVLRSEGAALELDLDGNGETDATLFDRASGEPDYSSFDQHVQGDRFRNHQFSLVAHDGTGRGLGGLDIERGDIQALSSGSGSSLPLQAGATAARSQELAGGSATRDQTLAQLDDTMSRLRRQALEDGTVPEALANAYRNLETAMLRVAVGSELPMSTTESQEAPRAAHRAAARGAAEVYSSVLEANAQQFAETENLGGGDGPSTNLHYTHNPVTGQSSSGFYASSEGYASELVARLRSDNDSASLRAFLTVTERFDLYLDLRGKERPGGTTETAQRFGALRTLRTAIAGLPSEARVLRGVFHLRQEFEEQGLVRDIAQVMFYWKDDSNDWHIKILTRPNDTREVEISGTAAQEYPPPAGLAERLDDRDLFPEGYLSYSFPGGPSGRIETTAPWEVEDIFRWVGTGLALLGLGLVAAATWGGAAPACAVVGGYILAGAGIVSAAGGVASMIDNASDGNWDTATWTLDALDVITGLAGGLSGAGQVAMGTVRQSAQAARATSQVAMRLASFAGQGSRFVTLTAVSMTGDVISGLIITAQLIGQYGAIDARTDLPPAERTRLKLMLLQNAAFAAGMMALSLIGNASDLRGARRVLIEDIDGVPVIRPGASAEFGEAHYRLAILDGLDVPVDAGERSRMLVGGDGPRADLPAGVELEVIPSRQFVDETGSYTGEALVRLRRGPDGQLRTTIVVREGADPAVVRRELVHVQQLESPQLRSHFALLTEENLARWPHMGAVERYQVAQSKLLVELDAQRRMVAAASRPGASEAALVDAEEAFQHIDNLQRQLDELSGIDPRALPNNLQGAPPILTEAHPPRLFTKTPASGAELPNEFANMDVDEFVAAYRSRYPDTTLSVSDLRARWQLHQRLHPTTGRLRSTIAGAGGDRAFAEGETVRPDVVAVRENPQSYPHPRRAAATGSDPTARLLAQRDAARAERDALERTTQRTPSQELNLSRARYRVNEASRQIGELGADVAVRQRFAGARSVQRIYPPPGTPSRSGDFDLVYTVETQPGRRIFVVIEAKGGGARLGTARVSVGSSSEVHQQGTRRYFNRTRQTMEAYVGEMPAGPEKQAMREFLMEGPDSSSVQYFQASTPIPSRESTVEGVRAVRSETTAVDLEQFDLSEEGEAIGRDLASELR